MDWINIRHQHSTHQSLQWPDGRHLRIRHAWNAKALSCKWREKWFRPSWVHHAPETQLPWPGSWPWSVKSIIVGPICISDSDFLSTMKTASSNWPYGPAAAASLEAISIPLMESFWKLASLVSILLTRIDAERGSAIVSNFISRCYYNNLSAAQLEFGLELLTEHVMQTL